MKTILLGIVELQLTLRVTVVLESRFVASELLSFLHETNKTDTKARTMHSVYMLASFLMDGKVLYVLIKTYLRQFELSTRFFRLYLQ